MQVRLRWVVIRGHVNLFRSVYVRILVILNRLNLIPVTGISRFFWWCIPPLIPCGAPICCDNRIITAFDDNPMCKNFMNILWETEESIQSTSRIITLTLVFILPQDKMVINFSNSGCFGQFSLSTRLCNVWQSTSAAWATLLFHLLHH